MDAASATAPCALAFEMPTERQCASTNDGYPDKRCSLAKVADSSYCAQHQPFPNLGVELRAYLRDDRNYFNEFDVKAFLDAAYPDRTREPIGDVQALAAAIVKRDADARAKEGSCRSQ